ncbi:MAG: DUF1465 family protein [Rhodospirillaceae bacterium]
MNGTTTYLRRNYDETMAMLIEARNYAAYHFTVDQQRLEPWLRLQACCESMRVTSRLTQVLAWLLIQRAVQAGELTRDQLPAEQFTLSGVSVCADTSGPDNFALPKGLRSLLERSHSLYARVSRLNRLTHHATQADCDWQADGDRRADGD